MKKENYAIIISGPSGTGKGTLIKILREKYPFIPLSVSHTTRMPRCGEEDGIDYYFVNKDEFFKIVEAGKFVEWEQVHDNFYGTHVLNIDSIEKTHLLFEIDVKGALNLMSKIKEYNGKYISIFLDTPDKEELIKRLILRGTENEESIKLRMKTSDNELSKKKYFDYIVVNDTIDSAFSKVENILRDKGVLEDGT